MRHAAIQSAVGRLSLLLVLFSGCVTTFQGSVPVNNIVMVDRKGVPVDPTGNTNCQGGPGSLCQGGHLSSRSYRQLSGDEYDKYLESLFSALGSFPEGKNGKKKILIYIHGGLNTQLSTIKRAYCAAPTVQDGGYFPIYLNWQSNLFTSYFNMLYSVRKGHSRPWYGPSTWGLAPFYVAQDAGRAVTRAVPVWSFMFYSDARSLSNEEKKRQAIDTYQEARAEANRPRLDLARGVPSRSWPERLTSLGSYVVTLPTKLLISPVLDAAGTPAWRGMLRASETAFRSTEIPEDLAREAGGPSLDERLEVQPTNGGFNVFLVRLKRYIANHGGEDKFEVVLVGHSMGAIVLNRILRSAEDRRDGKAALPVTHIVYMGAATSIKDYEDTVFPYLRKHEGTQMHHLVLHHLAETRDRVGALLDIPPRGSLLVWIDNFLNERNTYRDRTVGRIESLTRTFDDLDEWEDIVPQIHIREFDVGKRLEARGPQRLGDFGRLSYWDPECWKTHPTNPEACYDQPLARRDEVCRER